MPSLQKRWHGKSDFRRGFATTLAADAVGKVLSGLSVVLLIRTLQPTDYAFFTVFITSASALSIAAAGSVRQLYLRNEAERVARSLPVGSDFVGSLVGGGLLIASGGILGLVVVMLSGISAGNISGVILVVLAALYGIGLASTELTMMHYQAHKAFGRAARINLAQNAVLLAGVLFVVLMGFESGPGVASVYGAAVLLVSAGAARRILRSDVQKQRSRLRSLLFSGETGWLTLFYVATAGFLSVDVFVATLLLSDHDVASLGAALRYYGLVMGVFPALIAVMRVRTSQVDILDSQVAQAGLLLRWFRRVSLPLLACLGFVAVLAPFLIPILDNGRYPASVLLFEILLVGACAAYVTAPAPSLLIAQRRFRPLALTFVGATAINLIGDLVAARLFGVVGIATVSVSAYVLLAVVQSSLIVRLPATAVRALRPALPLSQRR